MTHKVLITIMEYDVAYRFDLATEVLVAVVGKDGALVRENTMVLPHASAEELCHLILTEKIDTVVCGGIEEEYYQYLTWKKVNVTDSVMGPWEQALKAFREGRLVPGAVLHERGRGCMA